MTGIRLATATLAAASLALSAAPATAQSDNSRSTPGWYNRPELSFDLVRWTTPAARLVLDWGNRLGSGRRLEWAFNVNAPFTLDADNNPETIDVAFSLRRLILDVSGTELTGVPGEERPDRGAARIGVKVGAEAAQRFEDVDVVGGVTLVYDHTSPTFWIAPAVDLAWDFVQCVGCDTALDDDDRYHKLDLKLDWSIRLDNFSSTLTGFRVRPSARLFKGWGVGHSLATLRNDEGFWGQAALAYHFERGVFHEVYTGWRAGQLPISLRDEKAWFVGVTLVF
jgi:hypothetical protein